MSGPTADWREYVQDVTALTDEALLCHAFGHSWEPASVIRAAWVGGTEIWVLNLHCVSCGMDRIDYLTPDTYGLDSRRYIQPEGYRVINPAVRSDYREEVVRRVREE